MEFTPSRSASRRLYGQVHVRVRPETRRLYLDYHSGGCRDRQHTGLTDTPVNRQKVERLAAELAAARLLGLDPRGLLEAEARAARPRRAPLFTEFARSWLLDLAPQWRPATSETAAQLVDTYLIPAFGGLPVDTIRREDLFALRRRLAGTGRRDGGALSPKVVNESMSVARRILDEAAQRMDFISPTAGVGRLQEAAAEVEPFTAAQVQAILAEVDGQNRALLTLAFGTGLRLGEIAGLRWDDVNLDGCHLQVRQTYARRRFGAPKSAAGRREVRLTASAIAALRGQSLRTIAAGDTVFQTAVRTPVNMKNFASRIWHPALQAHGLPRRRLYSTRHTFASLALAAGESPAWIARQLGLEDAQLLFRIYGHFVPRTGVCDGVAFERLLAVAAMPLRQMEINDAP